MDEDSFSDSRFRNGDRDEADARSCFLSLSLTFSFSLSCRRGGKESSRRLVDQTRQSQTSTKDREEEQGRQRGATRSSVPEGEPRTRAL